MLNEILKSEYNNTRRLLGLKPVENETDFQKVLTIDKKSSLIKISERKQAWEIMKEVFPSIPDHIKRGLDEVDQDLQQLLLKN